MMLTTERQASIQLNKHPVYDIQKTYTQNVQDGPVFEGKLPDRSWPDESKWIDFLGYKIASPLGVPAGPLLTSCWIALAARLGFDVLTYKTIRSHQHASHPLPNVIFLDPSSLGKDSIVQAEDSPSFMKDLSITNSFGNPSQSPSFLLKDIAKARTSIRKGQLLIVSVFGSTDKSPNLKHDFVQTGHLAKEGGAQVIEANFSCPNVSSKGGSLFADAEQAYEVASSLAKAVAPLPLMIKLGRFADVELMKRVLIALAKAKVRAVCGINTLSMRILDREGLPALGAQRETGGVCGSLIRHEALEFVRNARRVIDEEKLDLELAGCGGIVEASHFNEFLEAGAQVAMSATGMMWNPYLANEWQEIQYA